MARVIETEEGEEIELPTCFEVCPDCRGHGKRAFGGAAFTSSEWAESCAGDDEFAENYFSGRYDTTCEGCGGQRVVEVVDEERLSADLRPLWEQWQRDEAEARMAEAAERRYRRMESGEY